MSNISDEQAREVFNKIDADGSGTIDGKELERLYVEVIGDGEKAKVMAEYVFHETDKNHDQRISFEEFLKGLRS